MNKRTLYFFIVLLSFWFNTSMASGTRPLPAIKIDTAEVKALSVPVAKLDKYKKSADFNYTGEQPVLKSFWQKVLYKLGEIFGRVVQTKATKIIIYIVFIGIFVILMITMFGADIQTVFTGSKTHRDNIQVINEDNIETLDFDKVISDEIANSNYNKAVRYLYLKLLQGLTRNNLIVWQKEKTNRDYFRELLQSPYSLEFRGITSSYEYVWYGKFPINRKDFDTIQQHFKEFFNRLNA
jgi:hypothetical protein